MQLIDADAEHLLVALTADDQRILSGMMDMIARCPGPVWEDSTGGDATTAMTPEQFAALHKAWQALRS